MVLLCATAAFGLTAADAAAAVPTLAVNFSNAGAAGGSGPDVMIGWRFSTTSPISVSQLAFWDDQGDGLAESHQVGIWSAAGSGSAAAALLSTTVLAGTADPLAPGSFFRVANVTPLTLPAGDYVIGGLLQGNQVDPYKETSTVSGFAAATGITYPERRFIGTTRGFSRPDNTSTGLGSFGPNFTFFAVPEPSTAALAALAFAGLTARRQKQSR
jgi:hypothetical protein